jgi:crotonobetainyl-CoA:carnitine CoA-transferase CaiB-like acyl-CoA transferase
VFCARVQDYAAIAEDPQVLANGYIVEVPRPDGDPVRMVATPVQFSKTPTAIRGLAPEHGQHTEEILLEAGYSWDQIEELRSSGATGPKPEKPQA